MQTAYSSLPLSVRGYFFLLTKKYAHYLSLLFYTNVIHGRSIVQIFTSHSLPADLHLPVVELGLQPALLGRLFDFLHQAVIVVRVGHGLQHGGGDGVLLAVAVLQQRVEGVDLRELCLRGGRLRGGGLEGGAGGLGGGLAGVGVLERGRHGGHAVGGRAVLDGAGEGRIGAEKVLGPQREDAGVVLGYDLGGMHQ